MLAGGEGAPKPSPKTERHKNGGTDAEIRPPKRAKVSWVSCNIGYSYRWILIKCVQYLRESNCQLLTQGAIRALH